MKNLWMPLYIGDYLADTAHLSTLQHGAYLLLIMHYWRKGGLPNDDVELARIARMSRHEWAHARKVIRAFFDESMRHPRIDSELSRSSKIATVRQEIGAMGGRAKALKSKELALANATDLPSDLPAVCSTKPASKRGSKKVDSTITVTEGNPLPNGKGHDLPISGVPIETPEFKLYHLGKEILGPNSGGQIKRLRDAMDGSIALAQAALLTASTKHSPSEYIGGVIRGRTRESCGAADDRIT